MKKNIKLYKKKQNTYKYKKQNIYKYKKQNTNRQNTKRRNTKRRNTKRRNTKRRNTKKTNKKFIGGNTPCSLRLPTNMVRPWDPTYGGNFYKLGVPIGVGGTEIFPGNHSPSPQRTPTTYNGGTSKKESFSVLGTLSNPFSNLLNTSTNAITNFNNTLQGKSILPNPAPFVQNQQQI
tara:strand:- start:78 stop:608 length:531 start_codon:yes stop_codon:yes gene_type:complete